MPGIFGAIIKRGWDKRDQEEQKLQLNRAADIWYNVLAKQPASADPSDPTTLAEKLTGIDPTAWKNRSSDDRLAAFQAVQQTQTMEQVAQHLKESGVRVKFEQAQTDKMTRQNRVAGNFTSSYNAAVQAAGSFMPGAGEIGDQMAQTQAPEPDIARLFMRAGGDPTEASQMRENVARAVQLMGGQNGENLEPNWIEDPTSGMRFLGRGKTTLPSGMNPTVAAGNMPQVSGYTPAPTGRGGFTWLKTPTGEVDIDRNMKLLKMQQESILKDYTLPPAQRSAKLAEIDDAIEQLRSGPATTPAAAGKGKPITDKRGQKWLYLGNASDPTTDKNPNNWRPQ